MQHSVSEFIVIAPSNMGKSIQWAEPQLRSYLAGHFPSFQFRIEPFGPFADEDEFSIIPIMNRTAEPGEAKRDPDALLMCHLDPAVLTEIAQALRSFDPTGLSMH